MSADGVQFDDGKLQGVAEHVDETRKRSRAAT
jgi:hypothetical protein